VPYYAPSPFGFGGGGFYVAPVFGIGVGGASLFLILMGFAAFMLVSELLSDRTEDGVLTATEKTSVIKLQVWFCLTAQFWCFWRICGLFWLDRPGGVLGGVVMSVVIVVATCVS